MKQITIRGVDEALHEALTAEAKEHGHSLNSYALKVLRNAVGLRENTKTREYRDLDHLAGTWSEEEARVFLHSLQEQRKIDPDMWP